MGRSTSVPSAPRGVRIGGRELQFFDTHSDHRPDDEERASNLAEIRELWSGDTTNTPWIVCGDFNDTPGSRTHDAATEMFVDSWIVEGNGPGLSHPRGSTSSSRGATAD